MCIRDATIIRICGEISSVFARTLEDEDPLTIFASDDFSRIRDEVHKEDPSASDKEILAKIIEGYSNILGDV